MACSSATPQPGLGQQPPEDEKEAIRRAIQKELKIKEGVENLRRVATDRRHLGRVQQLLRTSNRRLEQLHGELQELHTRILLPGPPAGEWRVRAAPWGQDVPGSLTHSSALTTHRAASGHSCPGGEGGKRLPVDEGLWALHVVHTEPVAPGPRPPAEQPRARHLEALQRQLQVELKVKQGAENMTHTYASGTPKVRLLGSDGERLGSWIIKVSAVPASVLKGKCSPAIDAIRETQS